MPVCHMHQHRMFKPPLFSLSLSLSLSHTHTHNHTRAQLLFMEIGNIHAVRASADAVQGLCEDPSDQKFLSKLEATGWLLHVQSIMSAACSLARKMDVQRPVNQMIASPRFFKMAPTNLDLRCVSLPASSGAECKTRLEFRGSVVKR